MADSCLICRKHTGEFEVPGGALYCDELVYASHAHLAEGAETVYQGWLVVETRRHIPGLADLTDEEGRAIGGLVARLSRALKAKVAAEHVYAFVLGHGVPHLHVHLLPRYHGTPQEFWGTRIDEWSGAPRLDRAGVIKFCERLRLVL